MRIRCMEDHSFITTFVKAKFVNKKPIAFNVTVTLIFPFSMKSMVP